MFRKADNPIYRSPITSCNCGGKARKLAIIAGAILLLLWPAIFRLDRLPTWSTPQARRHAEKFLRSSISNNGVRPATKRSPHTVCERLSRKPFARWRGFSPAPVSPME